MVLVLLSSAHAAAPQPAIDPACVELAAAGVPDDYDEQAQTDFLSNYYALSSTFSPIHGPIPHAPGHGSIGVEASAIPPLGCKRRLVLNYAKTEDTNKSPVLPRLRASFAFPEIGPLHLYAGAGYVPPVTVDGVTTGIVSAELGGGLAFGDVQAGLRFHATSMKVVGEIATPFFVGEPTIADMFLGTTFGADLMFGMQVESFVPYASLGITDASSYFYVGDDGVVANNLHPYFGPVASIGADGLVWEKFRVGGEFYAAPGGYSLPDPTAATNSGAAAYGHLYTVRVKVGIEL